MERMWVCNQLVKCTQKDPSAFTVWSPLSVLWSGEGRTVTAGFWQEDADELKTLVREERVPEG